MAIVTTPLGFQKPDGTDPVRNGDNVIAANAQKAEDIIAPALTRLANVEAVATPLVEDPADPGFYIIGSI